MIIGIEPTGKVVVFWIHARFGAVYLEGAGKPSNVILWEGLSGQHGAEYKPCDQYLIVAVALLVMCIVSCYFSVFAFTPQ